MHLERPVAQRFHDHLQHARMIRVERIAGPGEVLIEAPVVLQPVIGEIVDAAERQCRTKVIALAGVIVNDIENDLDAGLVQPLDRCLKFGDRTAREKARVRREKADCVVAPIIREAAARKMAVADRRVYRQELDGGDAQLDEVIDDGRRGERGKRAAIV